MEPASFVKENMEILVGVGALGFLSGVLLAIFGPKTWRYVSSADYEEEKEAATRRIINNVGRD